MLKNELVNSLLKQLLKCHHINGYWAFQRHFFELLITQYLQFNLLEINILNFFLIKWQEQLKF
ncbi:MAG: hypothetical protein ACJAYD_000802 [Patiriisocius sp.]|jgi:hypothetical protein